ncbi:CIA30 family protein [Engelhardtia mirabilis]|uniref:Complex I intermediate-associated protein 30 (CIA30) n=1 Tax=Engelhardtia mirabilis TaxID=2528011 RepID=A0A518BE05_9BACT|nr:Complex I intermediate-associated protein 30 (CIA30) [Planctomycetes bacterium Pla133]QDU99536.1 Complex I intermediate-associated protein 30 (CIA30) [Planctomycetes bacterium Pla86]
MLQPLAALLTLAAVSHFNELETLPLMAFDESPAAALWRPVHDSVMGGVSDGQVRAIEGAVRMAGDMSLDNNGGFASFRAGVELPDLAAYHGLALRVRGDGQTYKLSLRTDNRWDGVSWQTSFATTADTWTTVYLAFEHLTPSWRGRLVANAGVFDASSIDQVGILIADKQPGPYQIDVAAIDAWRAAPSAQEGAPEAPAQGTRLAASVRTCVLAGSLDAGLDASGLVDALRWSERVLVIAAPDQLGAPASIQIGSLLARDGELANRELRIVHLMGSNGGRVAGRTLGSDQVRGLREQWDLPAGEWSAVLVGKDGGVKARWSEPVVPNDLFELIDAMPMRTREVDTRRPI